MFQEATSAAQCVSRMLQRDRKEYVALADNLQVQPPSAILTIARGSSDHAAHYMGYLMMSRLGKLVTSLPMSLFTLYRAPIQGAGLMSVAFSQSGRSPDLIDPTRALRSGGARTLAFINAEGSPLADAAEWVLPLHAGEERSVAATKSYMAQLVAGARLTAAWEANETLTAALEKLPGQLEVAAQVRWPSVLEYLAKVDKLIVVGRGTGMSIALEAALKFKETCGLQAEAFSGAEIKHGPMALIEDGYPLLIFAPRGPAQANLLALAAEMRHRGARVFVAAPVGTPDADLPIIETAHEDLDPISAIQTFYLMAEELSRMRGFNPDEPKHLAKVTQTH